jgi:NTP pyrophosphatase (non-canonical NTP hydrolase)
MTIERRASVERFSYLMEEVLRQNDYKGGWSDCSIMYLEHRMVEEVGEYFKVAYRSNTGNRAMIKKELIDIANFCMMLSEKY